MLSFPQIATYGLIAAVLHFGLGLLGGIVTTQSFAGTLLFFLLLAISWTAFFYVCLVAVRLIRHVLFEYF